MKSDINRYPFLADIEPIPDIHVGLEKPYVWWQLLFSCLIWFLLNESNVRLITKTVKVKITNVIFYWSVFLFFFESINYFWMYIHVNAHLKNTEHPWQHGHITQHCFFFFFIHSRHCCNRAVIRFWLLRCVDVRRCMEAQHWPFHTTWKALVSCRVMLLRSCCFQSADNNY